MVKRSHKPSLGSAVDVNRKITFVPIAVVQVVF